MKIIVAPNHWKMKVTFTLILLLYVSPLFSQNLRAGIIYPTSDEFDGCCMYVPDNGFKLYNKPSGKIVAQIVKGTPEYGEVYKLYLRKDGYPDEMIPYGKMEMVGYEVFSLVFTNKAYSFVKVLEEYWISIDEIKESGLDIINYRDYLIKKTTDVLGYYANPPGLNLRTGPSTDYEIIKTLEGDTMQITLTSTYKGAWCKVKVTEHKEHPCVSGDFSDNNIINEYEGWIKLLDEKGMPNVWHYAKGC